MTEAEYRTLPGADRLPVYDHDDSRCEELARPNSPAYDTVQEATERNEALNCVRDPNLEFRGGIRYKADGGVAIVYAYFWRLRK